jgi:hypothetical protein
MDDEKIRLWDSGVGSDRTPQKYNGKSQVGNLGREHWLVLAVGDLSYPYDVHDQHHLAVVLSFEFPARTN